MKIDAAVARGIGQAFSIERLDMEMPRSDEILVRVCASGICHTDIAMRDHEIYPIPHPCVFGHEGAGVVEQVGAGVTKVRPGDHVALSFSYCGECTACRMSRPSYCAHFDALNFEGGRIDKSSPLSQEGCLIHTFHGQSSFATHAVVHQNAAVKVREDVPFEVLGPMGCAVQTGAGSVINVMGLKPGQSIAIFGTGSVGLCALMAARLAGAGEIIAVDVSEGRLEKARELGATLAINSSREDARARILEATAHRGVDFTFDTTANMNVLQSAMAVLARLGTCVFVGGAPKGMELLVDVEHMMTGGRTLRGAILGDSHPEVFIPRMAELYSQGKFPLDRIVTSYPLEAVNTAVDDALSGRSIKSVLRMEATM